MHDDLSNIVLNGAINKKINQIVILNDKLIFYFDDGSIVRMFDDDYQCCEKRYMHTDDDLDYYVGSYFLGAEVRQGGDESIKGYEIESEFLIINTSLGQFTIVNYNKHNGYYSGFDIIARRVD